MEGLTKVFYPEGVQHGRVRHHGDCPDHPALGPLRAGPRKMSATTVTASAAPSGHEGSRPRLIAFAGVVLLALHHRRAVLRLSLLRHADALHRAVRLRIQPADRLCRPALVRPRHVSSAWRATSAAHAAKVWGLDPVNCRFCAASSIAAAARPRFTGALAIRSQRHLFRNDHGRAVADGLFLLRRGALHAWRGRHPVGAAGPRVRPDRHLDHARRSTSSSPA